MGQQWVALENHFASDNSLCAFAWQSPPPLVQQRDTARHALSVLAGKGPADWVAPDFDLTDFTLQGALAGRAVLQMAEAEPQAQGLPRHLEERRPHSDLGGALRQPAPRLSEVRRARRAIDATDRAIAPAQLIPPPRSLGAVEKRCAAAAITASAMGASSMIRLTDPLWDSSGSRPFSQSSGGSRWSME